MKFINEKGSKILADKINSNTTALSNTSITDTTTGTTVKIKNEEIKLVSTAGEEKLTRGENSNKKEYIFVPSGYEGSNLVFLRSDGLKPVWEPYSPPVTYDYYGVYWPIDGGDPSLTLDGSFDMAKSLPIQSGMYTAIVPCTTTSKTEAYKLDPNDWDLLANPTEISATSSITLTDSKPSGTVSIPKTQLSNIPNLASALNRLVDHYLQIIDNTNTKIKFYCSAVAEEDSNWVLTVSSDNNLTGIFNTLVTVLMGSDRTGYDGQVLTYVPAYYIKSAEETTIDNVSCAQVDVASTNLGDEWHLFKAKYVMAYHATLLNEVPENMGYLSTLEVGAALSINNTSSYCRGGGNRSARDEMDSYTHTYVTGDDSVSYRSDLGKPRTSFSRNTARTDFRKVGMENMSYEDYKSLYWLWVTEYRNFNSLAAFNSALTASGLKQGGMGNGLTTMSNWDRFNGYYAVMPNGYLDSLASGTGVKNLVLPAYDYDSNSFHFQVGSWGQHSYQENLTDKASIVNNITGSAKLVDSFWQFNITNVAYNGRAFNTNGSDSYGSATFHVTGLTGNLTIKLNGASSKSITFTADNQATVQSLDLNGFSMDVSGWDTTTDVAGHTYVADGTCDISIILDSFTPGTITIASQTVTPFKWRGIENLFGDIWNNLDGIVIIESNTEGGAYDLVYTTTDTTKYAQSDGSEHTIDTAKSNMDYAGRILYASGWGSKYNLGTTGNIFPIAYNGSSNKYFCDYSYRGMHNTTPRTARVGGVALSGASAGLGSLYSGFGVGDSWTYIGFRGVLYV